MRDKREVQWQETYRKYVFCVASCVYRALTYKVSTVLALPSSL